MTVVPTASVVRREGLEPLLDAQALNDRQAHQLANATEAIDCAADHLNQIAARPHDPEHVITHAQAALACVTGAFTDNTLERGSEQRATGFLDALTTDLRHAELNGRGSGITAREVARLARRTPDLLGVLSRAEAVNGARVLRFAPIPQLLSATVEREVGRRAFEPYARIVRALHVSGARAVGAGAAVDSPVVSGHAAP